MASVDAKSDSRALTQPRLSPRAPRGDIQALRALAVAAVVTFHVWPRAVTGGYVGVDVFFVISGYLITSQLLRRRERGTLKLGSFWAARARRLLPAALLVLLVSTALTLAFAPQSLVTQYLRSIVGSALYVENWFLAADAVDYLAAENAPPIAQQYWSLSVEEQFYILWPLLIIAATTAALTRRYGRRALIVVLATVTATSLVLSLVTTFVAPSFAYFATPVRMWEFGFGALVAVLPVIVLRRALRSALWVLGWAGLLYSIFLFTSDTAFPGYAAILPVAATAVLIWIGPEPPFRLAAAQNLRVFQWIGDNSYGIYLWHWPLVVIAPAIVGRDLDLWQNIALVILTCVLAVLSTRFVENPLRFGRLTTVRPRTILFGTAAAMILVVAAAGLPAISIAASAQAQTAQAKQDLLDPASCRGASMLLNPECSDKRAETTAGDQLIPARAGLYDDTDGAFACYASGAGPIEPCHIGSDAPDAVRIALTGDSHAAMLVPALRDVAKQNNWSVDVYVGRGCVWSTDPDPACADRQSAIQEDLMSGGYEAIIVTAWNQIEASPDTRQRRAAQFADRWREAIDAGIQVIPILDNPAVPQSAADCLESTTEFSFETCSFAASDYLLEDPLASAAESTGATPVDLRHAFCDDAGDCAVVAGGVIVYRDLHHITATFSHSLAPYLADEISAILDTTASPRP